MLILVVSMCYQSHTQFIECISRHLFILYILIYIVFRWCPPNYIYKMTDTAPPRMLMEINVQILWQARYFGHGSGLRHALVSWHVQSLLTFGHVVRFQKL